MNQFSLFHWLIVLFIVWLALGRPGLSKPQTARKRKPAATAKTISANNILKSEFKTDAEPKQSDAIEGSFWDVSNPKPSDLLVHLVYKDSQGLRTRRTVNVDAFGTPEDGAFSAKCLMRNAYRTFIYKRVEQAIDPETGEIINDLPSWLLKSHNEKPSTQATKIAFENLDLLKILLYVAKADGRMTTAEIKVITTTVGEILGFEFTDEITKSILNTLNTPSVTGYQQSVGRLIRQNRDTAKKTLDGAKSIVNTQKTSRPEERSAIEYLESKLIAD